MGLVYADIELVNGGDIVLSRHGFIADTDLRSVRVRALVDQSSCLMAINETIATQLRLPVVSTESATTTDGSVVAWPVVGPLLVKFENRRANVDAIVLPGDATVLLGRIPLGYMDVVVDSCGRLVVNPDYPDAPHTILK